MMSFSSLLIVVLTGCCFDPGSSAGPTYWRIVGHGAQANGWHVCNLRLFTDNECSRPVSTIRERVSSAYTSAQHSHNSEGIAFTEWKSSCKPCSAGEASIGARFYTGTMVQCVTYTTPSTWDTPCNPIPTPAPAPKATPAPAQQPTPAPAPEATVGPITTITVTTTTQGTTVSVTNPFDAVDFGGRRMHVLNMTNAGLNGGGLDDEGRMLSGTSPIPGKVVLERSEDGSSWSQVVQWEASSVKLSISTGLALQPAAHGPKELSWFPLSEPTCTRCARASNGLQPKQSLALTFNEWVRPGSGRVEVTRGGGLSSLALDLYTSPWFKFSGSTVTIQPQVAWGTSSSCANLIIPYMSVVDADGTGNGALTYTLCVADTNVPTLTTSTPKHGSLNVQATRQHLELSFNEAVQVLSAWGAAKLKVVFTQSATKQGDVTIPMQSPDVETQTWNPTTGATMVILSFPQGTLAKATRYELSVPAGSIKDPSNNAWAPTTITFTTVGMVAKTDVPTKTPSVAAPPSSGSDEGGMPVWIFAVVGLVLVVLLGACLASLGWRQYVAGVKRQIRVSANEKVDLSQSSTEYTSSQYSDPQTPLARRADGPRQAGTAGSPKAPTAAKPAWQSPAGKAAGSPDPAQFAQTAPESRRPKPAVSRPPRAKEAEDAQNDPHRKQPPPFHSKEKKSERPSFQRAGSFNDDNLPDGEGWVKADDAATGRPYWFHSKTKETRWDKPSGAKTAPSSPSGQHARQSEKQKPKPSKTADDLPAPPVPTEDDNETTRVTNDLLRQLRKTLSEPGASRKKTFKFLCLQWHPDKNADNVELATEIFQFLQNQRDWYLKDA